MLNIPECLAPAVEELEKNINQIAVLNEKNNTLEEEIQTLRLKHEEFEKTKEDESENFRRDISSLEEENLSLNTQLRDKETNIEALTQDNDVLNEKVSRINSENIRVNAGQEALSHKTQQLNEEIDKMTEENRALKDELSSLKLMNSIAMQKNLDEQGISGDEALELEIKRLKQELLDSKNNTSDNTDSFLQSENEKLIKRHGEITQEKMQASAKMHAAQSQLEEVVLQLDTARKSISELTFEYEGLQNLHQNIISERNALVDKNKSLEEKNRLLEQNLASDLSQEKLSSNEEVTRFDNASNKEFKDDVPVLEIQSSDDSDIETINSLHAQGPHFTSENR